MIVFTDKLHTRLIGNIENETVSDESLVYISDNRVFKNTGFKLDNAVLVSSNKNEEIILTNTVFINKNKNHTGQYSI